jgi:hypothetical protein
MKRRSKL